MNNFINNLFGFFVLKLLFFCSTLLTFFSYQELIVFAIVFVLGLMCAGLSGTYADAPRSKSIKYLENLFTISKSKLAKYHAYIEKNPDYLSVFDKYVGDITKLAKATPNEVASTLLKESKYTLCGRVMVLDIIHPVSYMFYSMLDPKIIQDYLTNLDKACDILLKDKTLKRYPKRTSDKKLLNRFKSNFYARQYLEKECGLSEEYINAMTAQEWNAKYAKKYECSTIDYMGKSEPKYKEDIIYAKKSIAHFLKQGSELSVYAEAYKKFYTADHARYKGYLTLANDIYV